MSLRAYRVIKIETTKPNSFNLWHDCTLVNFLDGEYGFFEGLNEGGGLTHVPIESLQRALAEIDVDPEVREALQRDIQAANDEGDDYVRYYCY